MTRLDSTAREILEEVGRGTIGPTLAQRARERVAVEDRREERKAEAKRARKVNPLKVAAKRSRKAAKRQTKAERNERMAAIRETVMERAVGRCELCRLCDFAACTPAATECHHILSGIGRRRQYESADTCVAVCPYHHDMLHRNDADALSVLLRWAELHGRAPARVAIETRQAKVREARAVSEGTR